MEYVKKETNRFVAEFRFSDALVRVWSIIHLCDRYIDEKRPWEISDGQREVIGDLLLAISEISQLLKPFLPETAEKIVQQLESRQSQPLFPRLS